MKNIFIFALEPIESRYTKQWYDGIPVQLKKYIDQHSDEEYTITTIDGDTIDSETTPGAFLNFSDTNYWKSSQLCNFIKNYYNEKLVNDGDIILFTDFWNPALIQLRYMSDLLDHEWNIFGIAHAGSYDPTDILGLKVNYDWSHNQERAMFHACDKVFYATDFHRQMFLKNLNIPECDHSKAIVSGQPHEESAQLLFEYFNNSRTTKTMVFPHRLNDDKQPEIFRDLVKHLPYDWDFVITQEHNYSKSEYYDIMSTASMIFSCSLHENLGISQMEGAICGAIPIMPTRASYSEMYDSQFLYPSVWTADWESYKWNREKLVSHLVSIMDRYETIKNDQLVKQVDRLMTEYMSGVEMYRHMIN